MTPQSPFMVLAPVSPAREAELRRRLDSMNDGPGRTRPDNPLIPFAAFPTLHVARLLLVEDGTVGDIAAHGVAPRAYPLCLAFLGDVDGDGDAFLEEVARRAPEGLRALFSCCEGFGRDTDLVAWMRARRVGPSAQFVNWQGRTARRVREDAALRDALQAHVRAAGGELAGRPALEIRARLRQLVAGDVAAGRLTLTPEAPTPLGRRL
ncbi:MAG TPA: hypothetical protein VLF95_13145, partial [Vicinamibacteria bacterium]|nr:hypothetical protein [Vicinamibacteria bacterium]